MKHLFFCLVLVTGSGSAFSQQSEVKTLQNGVTVHQATGNETLKTPAVNAVVKTVNDWNLSECIDGIRSVDEKIAITTERIALQELNNYRVQIVARKEQLLAPGK